MKYTKTMNKIIKLKARNRRISAILKHLSEAREDEYYKGGSYYHGWCKEQLEFEMSETGERILYLRERMSWNKKK